MANTTAASAIPAPISVHVPGFAPATQADEDAQIVTHVHLLQPTRRATTVQPLHGSLLLDHLRARARALGRSARTEQAYVYWARHFIWHNRMCDPQSMGWREWEGFQTHLEYRWRLSVNTRRQALSALRFFYREVLGCAPPGGRAG